MASARGARQAFIQGEQRINAGREQTFNEWQTGYDKASEQLGGAQKFYEPYAQRYDAGSSMYSDALGLGGAAGSQRALDSFQTAPGYGFQMDQGLQALTRKRAAGGMLNSGNADIDAMTFGQGLANQGWGSWLDRLSGMDQRGLATAGQQAGIQGQLAGLTSDLYNRRGNLIQQNVNDQVGLLAGALKAGDAAKAQNQSNMLAGAQLGLQVLGGLSGMSGGGGMGGGTGGMPGNMGFLKLFAGT